MRRPGFMTRDSQRAFATGEEPAAVVTTVDAIAEADRLGLEWHHLAGHSAARPRVGLYPQPGQSDALRRVVAVDDASKRAAAAERAAAKAAGFPTSKAAAWRLLRAARLVKDDPAARYVLPVKDGRFGPFVPSFGRPDDLMHLPDSPAIAAALDLVDPGGRRERLP